MTMTEQATVLTKVDEQLRGLEALRQHLADHPALAAQTNLYDCRALAAAWDPAEFAALVRDLKAGAPLGAVTKKVDDSFETVSRVFSETVRFDVIINRSKVCERVQVGVEQVEVPDPDAPTVVVERPVYEWKCEPILS